MIWAIASSVLGWLKRVPRDVWYIAGALALVWIVYQHGESVGYDKRDAEYDEAARKAAEAARKADAIAGSVVDQSRNEVEQGNEHAREAANGSDDPLRDGLNSLRR